MVQQDLYRHMEEVEYLAEDEWSDAQVELVRELISELTMIVRHVLGAHRADRAGRCPSCENVWPCQVVVTVHSLVKDPDHHFVRLYSGSTTVLGGR